MSDWGQFSTDGSPFALFLYSSEQYCTEWAWFHSGQVFHQLVCPLTVVLPLIFFNLATLLLSSFLEPFSCTSWCCCSLVFIRSLGSNLSWFSPSVKQIKNFCGDPGFFLLTMFAKDLFGCFSHCCVEGGDYRICVYSLLMMVRGTKLPPIIAWKVSTGQ